MADSLMFKVSPFKRRTLNPQNVLKKVTTKALPFCLAINTSGYA